MSDIPYYGAAVLQSIGSPQGVIVSLADGQLCVDRATPALYQSNGFGSSDWTILAGGGGGGTVDSVVAGTGIAVDDTDPANPVVSTSGESTIASLSGAGIDTSPGLLNQAGGMAITDSEGDGFSVETTSFIGLNSTGNNEIGLRNYGGGAIVLTVNGFGSITIGEAANQNFLPVPSASIDLPYTVVTGVNDTLTYTPIGTGTPDVFTVAPGVYNTIDDLQGAIGLAQDSDSNFLGNIISVIDFGGPAIAFQVGAAGTNGDILSTGPTDILVDISGQASMTLTAVTDNVGFYGNQGNAQQTITGTLSAVVDPNALAVLTSILQAFSSINLFVDATD